MNFLAPAIEYHEAGLKVIPFYHRDGGGVRFPSWEKYRAGQSRKDIDALFSEPATGIALLCTGGIEAIDIDVKHDPKGTITSQYLENLKASTAGTQAFHKCVIQRTKSKGWHIIYRTDSPEGNQKLTYRAESKEAVIETRGEGGLLFIAPSPGYEIKMGSLKNIGTLTAAEREIFFRCASELNERPDAALPAPAADTTTLHIPPGKSPGDDYNSRHNILDTAQRYGWTVVGRAGQVVRLNKPGSSHKRDIHASIVRTKTGEERFYPFTTATAYDPEKCYSAFGMYAVEEHRGDFSAAARALAGQGYGDRLQAPAPPAEQQVEQAREQLPGILQDVIASRFDYDAEIREEDTVFHCYGPNGRKYRIGGFGQIGVFTGHEKSGKSFVLGCMASAALAGRPKLNFEVDLRGRKMIWFDTEQSLFFYQWTQKRIHDMAGKRQNLPYYQAYHLRKFTPAERIAVIEHLIYREENIGILVIDGIVDLLMNYNDLPEVQGVVQRLMKWTDELNILLLSVLHVNKGDGKIRGHIGTEIKNKCDFAINVAKTGDNDYRISNPTGRNASFPGFEFSRDAEGLPIYDDNTPVSGAFPARPRPGHAEPEAPAVVMAQPPGIPAASRPGNDDDIPF